MHSIMLKEQVTAYALVCLMVLGAFMVVSDTSEAVDSEQEFVYVYDEVTEIYPSGTQYQLGVNRMGTWQSYEATFPAGGYCDLIILKNSYITKVTRNDVVLDASEYSTGKYKADISSEDKHTDVYAAWQDDTLLCTVKLTSDAQIQIVKQSSDIVGAPDESMIPEGKIFLTWTDYFGGSNNPGEKYVDHTYTAFKNILTAKYADAGIDGTMTVSGANTKVSVTATVASANQSGTMIGVIAQYEDGKFINTFVDAVYTNSIAKATFQISSVGLKSVLIEVVDGSTLDGETKTIGAAYEKILAPSS